MSITLAVTDDIAQITLDDGRANAIDPAWLDSFMETFHLLRSPANVRYLSK